MGFAAVALRYAFPVTVYAQNCATDSRGRTVTMQSISSSLKVNIINFDLLRGDFLKVIFKNLGNGKPKRYHDGRFPQLPSAISAVHPVQRQ